MNTDCFVARARWARVAAKKRDPGAEPLDVERSADFAERLELSVVDISGDGDVRTW